MSSKWRTIKLVWRGDGLVLCPTSSHDWALHLGSIDSQHFYCLHTGSGLKWKERTQKWNTHVDSLNGTFHWKSKDTLPPTLPQYRRDPFISTQPLQDLLFMSCVDTYWLVASVIPHCSFHLHFSNKLLNVEHFYMCCWPSISLLWKKVYFDFLPIFLIGLLIFFILSHMSYSAYFGKLIPYNFVILSPILFAVFLFCLEFLFWGFGGGRVCCCKSF